MSKKLLLLLILLLSLFLRFYRLGEFPATLYGDEQAFAWNAYNILKTGKDEYGIPHPLQFRSFDDYKAPIPVYLLVPFIKYLGLNSLAIRLPVALASLLTVYLTYHLSRIFFSPKSSLIAAYLLAISPWHVHLSRGYFEATLSLLFFISGIYFILKANLRLKYITSGMIFFAMSIYSYFTPRILVPFFILFLLWYIGKYKMPAFPNKRYIGEMFRRKYAIGLFILFILIFPLLWDTFYGQGFSRFKKLSESVNSTVTATVNKDRYASNLPDVWRVVFHNKLTVRANLIKDNYLEHLSFNFWYIYGDNSLRYFTGNMGMFYLFEMLFFLVGLYLLWRDKRPIAVFLLGWILLAPIPASLVGRPYGVRSLAILPAPFMIVAYGICQIFRKLLPQWLKSSLKVFLPVLVALSMFLLLIRYYKEYPAYAATWWGWENKAAIDYAKVRQDQYDYIFISDFYTGAPLAYAVYTAYDPESFRYAFDHPVTLADGRHLIKIGKYYFGSLDINSARLKNHIIPPKSLYIGRPEEADSDITIKAPDDGRIIFKIHKT